MAAHRARLRAIIEPVVTAAGYDLDDLSVAKAGRRSVVRVTVDGDGGVTHDALADISRVVSSALDAAEESGGEFSADTYELEVTSPGVDRPLTEARHWRRNVGRLVKVRVDGRQLTGRIMAADADTVVLDADEGRREYSHADLGPGRVQVEFARLAELSDEDFGDEFETDGTEDTEEADDTEVTGETGETDRDEEGVDRA
jgi:ribosome maturation factor RimP